MLPSEDIINDISSGRPLKRQPSMYNSQFGSPIYDSFKAWSDRLEDI